jgi:hypothetical protein
MAAIQGTINQGPHGIPELPNPKNADPDGKEGGRVAVGDEQENVPPVSLAQPPTPCDASPPSIYIELRWLIPPTLLATKAEDPGSPPWAQFACQGHPPREEGP